jgi:3-methyladenine DNA glycosylase AlkD
MMHEKDICMGDIILAKLKEEQRSIAWLAREIGADASNLRKQLKCQKDLHATQLREISKALKTDFFQYYSENLKPYL